MQPDFLDQLRAIEVLPVPETVTPRFEPCRISLRPVAAHHRERVAQHASGVAAHGRRVTAVRGHELAVVVDPVIA